MIVKRRISMLLLLVTGVVGMVSAGEPTVVLLEVSPGANSDVDDTKVLRVSAEYNLGEKTFAAGQFWVELQFATIIENRTFLPGPPVRTEDEKEKYLKDPMGRKQVTSSSGSVELVYPLKHVLRYRETATPLRVTVRLMEKTGERRSRVIALTEEIEFPVAPPGE
jgi:hypothetical protein